MDRLGGDHGRCPGPAAATTTTIEKWAASRFGGFESGEGSVAKDFARWFEGSQVVDANGDPQVVYHGSWEHDIEEFRGGGTAYGIFFAPDKETARYYAGDRGFIYEVCLKIERLADLDDPLVFDEVAREAIDFKEVREDDAVRKFAARLYKEGCGKNSVVTGFFDDQDGFGEVDGDEYTIEDLLRDNQVDASEVDDLVQEIGLKAVSDAYDDAAPVRSPELLDAAECYGSQNFYLNYQNDFMRAAQALGYDGVVFSDPSSTGVSVSYVVFSPDQIRSARKVDSNFEPNANIDMCVADHGEAEFSI